MPKVGQIVPYHSSRNLTLYLGDCVQILHSLPENSVDLAFADPPFNIDYTYDIYKDNLERRDYLSWTKRWLIALKHVLKQDASFYLAIGIGMQAEVKMAAESVGFRWRDTICWHYTFGPRQESKFTPSWVPIHYFTMSDTLTWNKDVIRVSSARQLKYKDKRAKPQGKLPDNVWVLLPEEEEKVFRPDMNSMLESRVCGTFKERTDHPCQMPTAVLDRIIKVSSNEGDVVCDPFLGSGTTAVSALVLGRKCIGMELSENYLRDCVLRRTKGASDD